MKTTTVQNMRHPVDDGRTKVYVGRGPGRCNMSNTPVGERGWLGNPFQSIPKFKRAFLARIKSDRAFRKAVLKLKGKALVCWCKPRPCHGDVIAAWIDNQSHRPRRIEP